MYESMKKIWLRCCDLTQDVHSMEKVVRDHELCELLNS